MTVAAFQMFSHALGTPQSVNVILPEPEHIQGSSVLYLLHGLLSDHNTWLQQTRLLDYARQYKLVVVMPYAQRSFYADQPDGYAWRTWVESELPAKIEQWLNIRSANDKRHIAGLSMGGYGALKLGLSQPERYQSMASFSGVLDLAAEAKRTDRSVSIQTDLKLSFGSLDAIQGSGADLFALPLSAGIPPMFVSCGLSDSLLPGNQRFRTHLEAAGVDLNYQEMAGGHEWSLWDLNVAEYLRWLVQRGLLTEA